MKTLLTIVGILLSLGAVGQKGITLGAEAGIGLTNIRQVNEKAYPYVENKAALGYNVNAVLICQGKGIFGISTEPGFTRRGYKDERFETAHFKFNYITLPVMLRFRIIENLFLGIGCEVSYMVSSRVNNYKLSSSGIHEDLDYGALAGGNLKIYKRFDLSLKYYYGIAAIQEITLADDAGNETGEVYKAYNTALQLSLRYNFIKPSSD